LTAIVAPHRATWLGARWCSNTGASRSVIAFLSLLAATLPSVVILFVFSDRCDVRVGPQSNSYPSHQFHRRDREFLLPNPATDRVPTNAHDFCDFNRRMSSHLNNGIGLCDVSSKKRTRMSAILEAPIRANESIPQKVLRGEIASLKLSTLHCVATLQLVPKRTATRVVQYTGHFAIVPAFRLCPLYPVAYGLSPASSASASLVRPHRQPALAT
jgi:hypothetical protein